jgi:putative endonuclease
MYYVYILYSPSRDIYYKGFSEDVEKRLTYHINSKGKYTSGTEDWEIVYVQSFESKTLALIEEKRLKKLNRVSIEKLIKQ